MKLILEFNGMATTQTVIKWVEKVDLGWGGEKVTGSFAVYEQLSEDKKYPPHTLLWYLLTAYEQFRAQYWGDSIDVYLEELKMFAIIFRKISKYNLVYKFVAAIHGHNKQLFQGEFNDCEPD